MGCQCYHAALLRRIVLERNHSVHGIARCRLRLKSSEKPYLSSWKLSLTRVGAKRCQDDPKRSVSSAELCATQSYLLFQNTKNAMQPLPRQLRIVLRNSKKLPKVEVLPRSRCINRMTTLWRVTHRATRPVCGSIKCSLSPGVTDFVRFWPCHMTRTNQHGFWSRENHTRE